MKQFSIFFLAVCMSFGAVAVTPIPAPKIAVYYFHYTQRNKKCLKVEEVSKNAVLTLFPVKVKRAEIFFQSINLDEKDGAALGAKLKIKKRTLIVILNEKRVDISKQAFKYAVDAPDKLTELIKNTVESIVK